MQARQELAIAYDGYARQRELADTYRATLLPNAETIIRTASARLQSGEINYLDWVILVNGATETRSRYFDVVEQLNETQFEIERLTGRSH
ncbi:MAG: hypothetical protein EOP50_15160 [Sphingobacteriales bacterium]|nr:MAG: hypothetical protein EOP50_15160 [Sphingobacteriales bacterium]